MKVLAGFGLLLGLSACVVVYKPTPVTPTSPIVATPTLSPINALRANAGQPPLRQNARLAQAAQQHAQDMAQLGYFGHIGSDGSVVGDRVKNAGYSWCGVAENIAKGQGSLDAALSSWMATSGHRDNLLHPNMREVAVVEGPDRHWVMVLAYRC